MGSHSQLLQLEALLDANDSAVTTLANASAFLYDCLDDVNWVGFYLLRGDILALGPFQGKPACTRIPVGKGVCGAAFAKKKTLRIDDVHAFEGHIACDTASRSEIVVVLLDAFGEAFGVLDVDSPKRSRFSARDQAFLERAAKIVSDAVSITDQEETGIHDIY
jgi:GAF domain-containing protein